MLHLHTWVWDLVGSSSGGVAPCCAWVGRGGRKGGRVVSTQATAIEQSMPLQPGSHTQVLMLEHF